MRFSVNKAEWNEAREQLYKTECLEVVYKQGRTLVEQDDSVLLNGEVLGEGKHKWFQTWKLLLCR